jgi:hypothetical protein
MPPEVSKCIPTPEDMPLSHHCDDGVVTWKAAVAWITRQRCMRSICDGTRNASASCEDRRGRLAYGWDDLDIMQGAARDASHSGLTLITARLWRLVLCLDNPVADRCACENAIAISQVLISEHL